MATAGSIGQAPPSEPIGTRLMLSTPPPIGLAAGPTSTCAAAMFTASRPEAQKRLTCTPATRLGVAGASTAVRAMSAPCSPTGDDAAQDDVVDQRGVEIVAVAQRLQRGAARRTGVTSCSEPSFRPLPRGVRTAS